MLPPACRDREQMRVGLRSQRTAQRCAERGIIDSLRRAIFASAFRGSRKRECAVRD